MLLAETNYGNLLLLAAVLALTVILLRRLYSRTRGRRKNPRPIEHVPRPRNQRPELWRDAPAEVQRWEVGMHETARDLSARLDSKMIALEHLIRTADERAARLEELLAKIEAANRPDFPAATDAPDGAATSDAKANTGV